MAIACPVCGNTIEDAYCATCGTPAPTGHPPEATAKPKRKPASSDSKPEAPSAASKAQVSARRGYVSIRWAALILGSVVIFAAGAGTGYGLTRLSAASANSSAAVDPNETSLEAANRLLGEGEDLLSQGTKDSADKAAAKFRQALAKFNDAIAADPNNLYARTYMGLTQFYLGQSDQAFQTLKGVLDKDPKYLWALFSLAWMSEVTGKTDDARRYYQQYVDAAPTEKLLPGKYDDQPGLIDKQLEIAKSAPDRLKGGTTK